MEKEKNEKVMILTFFKLIFKQTQKKEKKDEIES